MEGSCGGESTNISDEYDALSGSVSTAAGRETAGSDKGDPEEGSGAEDILDEAVESRRGVSTKG